MRKLSSTISDAAPWLGLTAVIGLVDYFTPSSYGFASIYFIPIFPAAWRSRAVGFVVAAASSLAWIACDYVQRPVTDVNAQIWNYATRIMVFILAVVLASTLQREQHRIGELDRQRGSLLTLLEHEVPGPLRELATELRGISGVAPAVADRLTKRAEQLVFLSDDLASLGELEAADRQIQRLLQCYGTHRSPLALGSLHETAAHIALRRKDRRAFTQHIKQVERGNFARFQFSDDGTRGLTHQPLISHFALSVRFRFLIADGAVEHFPAKWNVRKPQPTGRYLHDDIVFCA